ncbi:MAG: carbamoyl-phosphate synthase large subunit [Candidatus Micrarchaeia archaeon]
MPKISSVKKVLLLGSGPIVIGQAAEFDYSGSQACRALKEEGIEVVLVNSNPATIQTDLATADRVYIEPLDAKTVGRIIEKEKPDGIIATMAGQTGLNIAVEIADCLKKNNVRVLGTTVETIELAEDREKFKELMLKIGEPVPASESCKTIEKMEKFVAKHGLPVMIRADFCLGGLASGIAHTMEEAREICGAAIKQSGTGLALVEKSLGGMAELEYEVIRDSYDNCVTICNMENLDPMGVHTGESVVVAPSQTLSDREYHVLRTSAIKIVRALAVQGACNVQFALDQKTGNYFVVEVNPRASRSSALASKATGYPIARVATKIALGYALSEIENRVTGKSACFEPSLDYVVVKIPRWPFDKLYYSSSIGTQMKSTGETMAIGRTFEEAFGKALRSLEMRVDWRQKTAEMAALPLHKALAPSEMRFNVITQLLFENKADVATISKATGIHEWFIQKIAAIVAAKRSLAKNDMATPEDAEGVLAARKAGFSERWICEATGRSAVFVRSFSKTHGLNPSFKMVDTCSAEFEAATPYYYSTYESSSDALVKKGNRKKVIILGSGPIRIGQGIEFDYCTVHAVQALRDAGFETIVVNNNPETVSTDFDISDRLYFEPLKLEDVLAVLATEREDLEGIIVQFGGQTSINLVNGISQNSGAHILGTSTDSIDVASNRKRFKQLTETLGTPTVKSGMAFDATEAIEVAKEVGYPVLMRPSYVLGGRAMHLAFDEAELREKVHESIMASEGNPVIIDHFLEDAIEIDVDIVGDGSDYLIAGIMEQVEEVGVHSGDSAAILPTRRLSKAALSKIEGYALKLASALKIVGLCNIQMAAKGDDVYIIEVNPRASRTVPFVSKAIGVPIAKVAALCQVGVSLKKQGYSAFPKPKFCAVKVPVFPYNRFPKADYTASSEMKSTGETMAFGRSFEEAYLKGVKAAGVLPKSNKVIVRECGKWHDEIVAKAKAAGFEVILVNGNASKMASVDGIGLVVDGMIGCAKADRSLCEKVITAKIPIVNSYYGAMALFDAIASCGGYSKLAKAELPIISLNEANAQTNAQ